MLKRFFQKTKDEMRLFWILLPTFLLSSLYLLGMSAGWWAGPFDWGLIEFFRYWWPVALGLVVPLAISQLILAHYGVNLWALFLILGIIGEIYYVYFMSYLIMYVNNKLFKKRNL